MGAVLDEAIAPIVDDDPADLVAEQASDVLPENDNNDALVRQLEEKLGQRFDSTDSLPAEMNASQLEAIPASGDSSEMARNLLKQVIPQGGKLPRSAAPLRDFGRDLFSAPAPGQGAASQALPRVPAQSQVIRSSPF